MTERDELLDEATLRRALRFESDEPVPRFDVAAIAALAEGGRLTPRILVVGALACTVVGLAGAAMWSALVSLAPEISDATIGFAIDAIVRAATVLEPVAELASQPAVPVSLLAALAVAIVHEVNQRREPVHANAS